MILFWKDLFGHLHEVLNDFKTCQVPKLIIDIIGETWVKF